MAIKFSQLKQEEIRATIPVEINGKVVDTIHVFNIRPSQKQKFQDFLGERVDNFATGQELEITAEEMFKFLFVELTDIQFDDEDFLDILENPRIELTQTVSVINEIIHELVFEILENKIAELHALQRMKHQSDVYEQFTKTMENYNITPKELKAIKEERVKEDSKDEELIVAPKAPTHKAKVTPIKSK